MYPIRVVFVSQDQWIFSILHKIYRYFVTNIHKCACRWWRRWWYDQFFTRCYDPSCKHVHFCMFGPNLMPISAQIKNLIACKQEYGWQRQFLSRSSENDSKMWGKSISYQLSMNVLLGGAPSSPSSWQKYTVWLSCPTTLCRCLCFFVFHQVRSFAPYIRLTWCLLSGEVLILLRRTTWQVTTQPPASALQNVSRPTYLRHFQSLTNTLSFTRCIFPFLRPSFAKSHFSPLISYSPYVVHTEKKHSENIRCSGSSGHC